MAIADHQLHTVQAAVAQLAQEPGPEHSVLAVTDLGTKDLTTPVGTDTGSEDDGLGHHAAVDSGFAVGRVEELVGERAVVQGPGVVGGGLFVEAGADPRDLGLADPGTESVI